ncbi:MAG: phytanoyl-CoA dioxygenase family protein [Deltaproteobacteria bacterium]|jgi:phytanoyl-CoA hydroxylase|nr:phytanoyl-CoA dioxygenase family protein [Deltaproteobacteria bacterium]
MEKDQIDQFWKEGYVVVESVVPRELIEGANIVLKQLIEASCKVTLSNSIYDLSDQHTDYVPSVRRIKDPHLVNPVYDQIMRSEAVLDCVRALVGPDLRMEHSKLNIKQAKVGEAVEWHQDWAFYPHSNDDILEVGVLLEDCDEENGPLLMIPESHRGPIENHHHPEGFFCGAIDIENATFDAKKAVSLTAKAGAITMHHVRMVHGSRSNQSERNRPILLIGYSAADAWPLRGISTIEEFEGRMICGKTQLPRLEKVPVRMPYPPAPDQGSIFENQRLVAGKSFQ